MSHIERQTLPVNFTQTGRFQKVEQLLYAAWVCVLLGHFMHQLTTAWNRILLWAVQLQGQWRSISTELHPDRHRGWPPHPSQRSGGRSTITEEREVSWSRQHPSRTGPSRWRGCNHRSHDNLQQDLADRRMANPMDPVLSHHTSQERQPAVVPEKPNNKPHQSPKQSHAEDHTEEMEATSGEDHRRRTGKLQSRKEYHRADHQPTHSMWEISPAPAIS